jgi:thioredoxin-related protein
MLIRKINFNTYSYSILLIRILVQIFLFLITEITTNSNKLFLSPIRLYTEQRITIMLFENSKCKYTTDDKGKTTSNN